jgi:hypothetical protein
MKKILLVLIINFSVFCTLIVTIEILGQIFYYLKTGRFVFEDAPGYYGHLFELHPYLAGRLKKNATVENNGKRISTTSYNTRWTGNPEDDSQLIRVAALGGSTTFSTGVTDNDTWPALLQAKLGSKFSVINFGIPGYSTAEAIIQMALIVPEIKPHFVILYEGWNDIRNYHETDLGADYYGHGMRQYGNLSIATSIDKGAFNKLYDVSATVRFAAKIKSITMGYPYPQPYQTFSTPDPFVDKIYLRNLKTLRLLSQNLLSYIIFVPQVLNWTDYRDSVGWSRHIENSSMPELLHRLNILMKTVCYDGDPKCVFVDSVLKEKWTPEDFVDDGHFSKKGGEKFAQILGEVILQKTREGDLNNNTQKVTGVEESCITIPNQKSDNIKVEQAHPRN